MRAQLGSRRVHNGGHNSGGGHVGKRICRSGKRIGFGTLTGPLASGVRIVMNTALLALSDADALLREPALLRETLPFSFWGPFDAHPLGRLHPGLLIGRDAILMGQGTSPLSRSDRHCKGILGRPDGLENSQRWSRLIDLIIGCKLLRQNANIVHECTQGIFLPHNALRMVRGLYSSSVHSGSALLWAEVGEMFCCEKRWALESQRTKGTAEEQMRLILKSEIVNY
jgi:hypothetical protein